MEDSKHTKKNKPEHLSAFKLCLVIFGIIVICGSFYFLWYYCFFGHPVTTRQIVFEFPDTAKINDKKIPDSTLNIIDKKDFEEIQKLAQDIIETNKDISEKIIRSEYLSVSNLNGFYAALFTFMAVIAGIFGFVGWRSFSEYKKHMEQGISDVKKIEIDINRQTSETKEIFERAQNKSKLVNWTEDQFKKLANKNLTSLPRTKEIEGQLKKIKDYVISEFTTNSQLEIFYAYHLAFTNKKRFEHFEKAKKILQSILERDLLDDFRVKGQIFHILGQINFELYLLNSEKWNFFKSADKSLNTPPDKDIEEAIKLLEYSAENYKTSFEIKEKTEPVGIDETRGNLAMVLIELHKFSIAYHNHEKINEQLDKVKVDLFKDVDDEHISDKDYLTHAKQYQKKIEDKSFNQLWDDARRVYYENKFEEKIGKEIWTVEDEGIWMENIHDVLVHRIDREIDWTDPQRVWKMEEREFFSKQLKKEILEFNKIEKKGFPGKTDIIKEIDEMLTKK